MRKILSLVLCLLLVASMSAFAEPSASDLVLNAFSKLPTSFTVNLNVGGRADFVFSMPDGSQDVYASGSVSGLIDYVDSSVHGSVKVLADVSENIAGSDAKIDMNYEFYIDAMSGYLYSSQNGDGWTRSVTEISQIKDEVGELASQDRDSFDSATVVEKIADGYVVRVPLMYLIRNGVDAVSGVNGDLSEQIGGLNDPDNQFADVIAEIERMVQNVTFDMCVNNDNVFTGIHLTGFDLNIDTEIEGVSVVGNASLKFDIDLTNIDSLTASDVAVPQEIVDSASDDIVYLTSSVGKSSNNLDLSSLPADALGSLNGYNFSVGASDYNVFVNDGWTADYDGQFSFLVLKNDAYGYNVDLSVFSYPYASSVTEDMVKTSGIGGYDISCIPTADNLPNMTWGGLTWCASIDDVKGVYGEPVYDSVDSGRGSMTYYIDYDRNWSMSFYFDKGLLTAVKMDCSR